MATIIDSLIVTLGLDNSDYLKKSKEGERTQKKFRDDTRKTGVEVGDSLKKVGLAAAGLFLGFETIKGAILAFAGLQVTNANLGRFSTNLGQSAHEVNTWGMAVELAGGSASDAQADLQNLQQSITDLKATGTVSPLLLLFQRLGVAILDAQGKTRRLTDIYKDAGEKLRSFNRADAAALARGAGISDSTLNLIISEGKERERVLRLAESNNKVNEQSIKDAEKLQEEWREIGQDITAVGNIISSFLAPKILGLFNLIKNHGKAIGGIILATATGGLSAITARAVLQKYAEHLEQQKKDKAAAQAKADAARTGTIDRGHSVSNNPGNLKYAGQAGATKGDGGFAAFATLAEGIVAANKQLDLYARRGINTISQIVETWAPAKDRNNVPAYIAALVKRIGKGANEQLDAADRQKLLQGIFTQENRTKVSAGTIASLLPNPNALATAQFANTQVPGGGGGTAAGNTNSTNVQIDSITVQTQATDADSVAAELPAALQRKGVVAQADTGMT